MPARVSSVTIAPGNALSPSLRMRSPDPGQDTNSLLESGPGNTRTESVRAEQRVVHALVGRLVNKVSIPDMYLDSADGT